MEKRSARLGDWLWLLSWMVGSSAACLSTAWHTGATFDEPLYMKLGLDYWRTGSHAGPIRYGTMPLPLDLYTLPLHLWERSRGAPFELPTDVEMLLPWYRVGALAFWCLLLIYARLIGRELAGPWAGRLAVALVACEPSLLAHGSLGGTDIVVTACIVALVYHFRIGRDSSWPRRLAVPAIWYAAAVLAKASGLVFGPLCMVVLEVERLARQGMLRWPWSRCREPSGTPGPARLAGTTKEWLRETWALFAPLRRDLTVILGVGLALVFIYCGCDWKPEPSFVAWAKSLPDGTTGRACVWVAEHLCIFSNAGEGLVRQIGHNLRGHGVYMLGTTGPSYFWYYFPVALTMKLSVTLLLAPLLVALVNRKALLNWALLTAAGLLVFSLNCHVQIGIRLVLPLCALLAIGMAAAIVQTNREAQPATRRVLVTVSVVGVLWPAVAAASVWPNWLCYVNEFWGGTRRGYLCLSDSNYDWGQGVPELARWRQAHTEQPLDVWYFGTDPLLERLPVRQLPLHTLRLATADDAACAVRGHYLAASTTLVYGSYAKGDDGIAMRAAAEFLRRQKPVARTTTFLIYDFVGREEAHVETRTP